MKIGNAETDPITRLVRHLVKLPGIGPKSAQRIALSIMRSPRDYTEALADCIREVAEHTYFCSICDNISSSDPCAICSDRKRDRGAICVVEESADVTVIEKTSVFKGLYHVLHGTLNPMNGVGPEDIKIERFMDRVAKGGVREVIIATNPDAEGEATARYLANRLKSSKVKVTRIARGVPMGSDLQYVDESTLVEALSGRREYS